MCLEEKRKKVDRDIFCHFELQGYLTYISTCCIQHNLRIMQKERHRTIISPPLKKSIQAQNVREIIKTFQRAEFKANGH